MEKILQTLRDLEGVRGTFLFDSDGQVAAHLSHSVYDKPLLENVSRILVKALDSLQFQHEGWDSMIVHFTEGKLLLKNVGKHTLAIIADNTVNLSFANVAVRVADTKIRKMFEKGGELVSSAPILHSPAVAEAALSWSASGSGGPGASSLPVADEASHNYLTRCHRALAQSVGPMARVFIKECVHKVCPTTPFCIKDVPQLLEEMRKYFDDAGDYANFKNSIARQ